MIRLVSVAALAATAFAANFETWQVLEAPLVSGGSTTAIVHSQLRQRSRLHDFFQARVGPVVRHELASGVALIAGYYFGETEEDPRVWGNNHRSFGGVERGFLTSRGVLSVRHLVEHHFGGSDRPELRNRSLVQWSRPIRSVTGFLGGETFFDQNGFIMQRVQGGLRLPFTSSYRLEVTYIFDARVNRVGESRHVIQTSFRPRRREK